MSTQNTQTKTIFVGLSGGVDSAVAAKRLLEQGYQVVGVFIKVWQPEFITCNWEAERLDAMRVAAHLGIPFLTCDAEAAYRDEVGKYFISEYLAGRTPNPDVMCNQHVKFGAFMDFAKAHGADGIATGHYVQRVDTDEGPSLVRGVDETKDQSYFLWSLTTEQLAFSLFPVGDTAKATIRQEAADANIPTAAKHDSQGICFLGKVDIADFLSHFTTLIPGAVMDTTGNIIGTHQGALVYTIGQRHGFTITSKDTHTGAQYVVARNLTENTITVSPQQPQLPASAQLTLKQLVLCPQSAVGAGDTISFQTRYRQAPQSGTVLEHTSDKLVIQSDFETDLAAAGQSCVLYLDDICLGGGIIQWCQSK